MAPSHLAACVLLLLGAALPLAQPLFQVPPLPPKRYLIFGYGSLLNTASVEKSNCGLGGMPEGVLDGMMALLERAASIDNSSCSTAIYMSLKSCQVQGQRVVRIQGLQRGWYYSGGTFNVPAHPFGDANAFGAGNTQLATVAKPGASVTGLVYEADESEYQKTVRREGGYLPTLIPTDSPDITLLAGPPLPPGAMVVYFAANVSKMSRPSAQYPIAYSYIDVWLGGAWDLQLKFNLSGPSYQAATGGKYESFVEETIKSTDAWSRHIVNDRAYPLRAYVLTRYSWYIDAALWRYLPRDILRGIRYPGQTGGLGLGLGHPFLLSDLWGVDGMQDSP